MVRRSVSDILSEHTFVYTSLTRGPRSALKPLKASALMPCCLRCHPSTAPVHNRRLVYCPAQHVITLAIQHSCTSMCSTELHSCNSLPSSMARLSPWPFGRPACAASPITDTLPRTHPCTQFCLLNNCPSASNSLKRGQESEERAV